MVVVLPNGDLILESGDPSFQSVQDLGPLAPTNYILDPNPNRPLTQLVLETFGISFSPHPSSGRVLGGSLPGFDIRNQDATTVLRLSLATELREPPAPSNPDQAGLGDMAEIELDEFGIARFFVVGEDPASNIQIRYCVPTSQIRNPADLVVVRGYDPPPRRELRNSFDGLKNAEIMNYADCAAGSCDERAVGKYASISYDDPLLDQSYLDDIVNSYEITAFENLIGYIVDLDLPSGTDPDSSDYQPGLKVTFSDTTREYITVPSDLLNNQINAGTIEIPTAGNNITTANLKFGFGDIGFIGAGGGDTTVTISSVDPKTGICTVTNTTAIGSKFIIPVSRFTRLNKYGRNESDFIGVQEIIFSGRKIITILTLADIPGFSDGFLKLFAKPQKELIRLEQGKNWTWAVDADGNVEIELFSIVEDEATADIAKTYRGQLDPGLSLFRYSTDLPNIPEVVGTPALAGAICNIGDRLGYIAINGSLCVVVDRKRPTVDIFSPDGDAESLARGFLTFITDPITGRPIRRYGVRYTPIVIIDEPAPIAYAATGPLRSIDAQTGIPGSTILPSEGIIDQTDGIVDADPATVQDLEESELQVLQDNTSGATIDITLPFLTAPECLEVARNILAFQTQVVNTQSIILGPDSEPRLGQIMPDGSIINEINYSYSDGSQYLITISTGPKFLTAGTFQNSAYQLRTEDITREGVIVQDLGNGAEYVVRIDGFGELNALSMIIEPMSVGDRVSVRLYNHPVERIS